MPTNFTVNEILAILNQDAHSNMLFLGQHIFWLIQEKFIMKNIR